MRKKLVWPLVIAAGLVLGGAGTAAATYSLGTATRFYGPTTPSGGFFPECAEQQGETDASFSQSGQHGAGGGIATAWYSTGGGTCNGILDRPYGYIIVDAALQRGNGTVCTGFARGRNSDNTSVAESATITRGYSGPCPTSGGDYYAGIAYGLYYAGGTFYQGSCCSAGPFQIFPSQ